MKLISTILDGRINAKNHLLEISVGQYLVIAKSILDNNEFQRRRVKSSPTLYSLLKEDLLRGCVIPSIVLAYSNDNAVDLNDKVIECFILDKSEELLILDGLQRTESMLELEAELNSRGDSESLTRLHDHTIRIEVYVGVNKIDILYRMLTLNTGQTPMSLRQQVEILFLDYARMPLGDIQLIREVDNLPIKNIGQYSFKAVIGGFNSYLDRNELPFGRYDLLESVKSLEKLSKESEPDLFKVFIESYHHFVKKIDALSDHYIFTTNSEEPDYIDLKGQPFGKDARTIFSKEQALAGFGAAVGKLFDFGLITSFNDIKVSVDNLNDDAISALHLLLTNLESIRLSSKKIGNSQRLYFHFYFRELFNPEGDAYRNVTDVVDVAYNKYLSQTS
jgi:hypothetical protein